ncbi:Fe-S oxidoreductase [Sphingobium sp. AN558]
MKSIMLAGAALLTFSAGLTGMAVAQTAPAQTAQPTAADPASSMPMGDATQTDSPAAASPQAADPNAGQPTGAVPADTGMVPAPADAPKDATAPVGTSANPVTVGGNVTPPPTEAKDYPVCSKTVQDSCINRGEGQRKARRHR